MMSKEAQMLNGIDPGGEGGPSTGGPSASAERSVTADVCTGRARFADEGCRVALIVLAFSS